MNELPLLTASILIGFFGLLFGSFFNVIIYRMPRNESLSFPASHCTTCKHPLSWYHNIPLFSWIFLGGKCAFCKEKISFIYPMVELIGGVTAFLTFYLFNMNGATNPETGFTLINWPSTFILLWILMTAIPVFVIDIKHQLIPDSISIGSILIGLAIAIGTNGPISWQQSLIGIIVCGGGLFIFSWIVGKLLKKEAMGFGDIKLVAGFGAFMGWELTVLAIVLAALVGILITLPLKLVKREGKEIPLPFGPYLYIGAIVAFVIGNDMITWYLNNFIYL